MKPYVGKLAILLGIALLMFGIFGASARTYPEYTAFYGAGAAGIVAIAAGILAGAISLGDDP